MITLLDTENADRNIAAEALCLTHTPSADRPRLCQVVVLLGDGTKDLDGTGGNFSLRVDIGNQTGAVKMIPAPAATTRACLQSDQFSVPANMAVTVHVLSPNAADTDVDVTAHLYALGVNLDTIAAVLGTPVALDGGSATLAGMLTKIADDNGGADYDAGTDSLAALRVGVDGVSVSVFSTTVASVTSAREFTLTDGWAVKGAYLWNLVKVVDATTGKGAIRHLVAYAADKTVTLNSNLPFTPEAGDAVTISGYLFPMVWGL